MQKALLFLLAVLVVYVVATRSSKTTEGFQTLMGVNWTSMNEGTPKACYSDLPIDQPKTPALAEAGVGAIQPSPPPAADLPAAPFGQRSTQVPSPYKDPTNEPAKYIRLLSVKEDLQAFFGFEASLLETRSDPALQIPLTRARADMAELIDVQSVMERNPGLPSRINTKQLDDILSNLRYLRSILRDLRASGAIQETAPVDTIEGFQNQSSNQSSTLKDLQQTQMKFVLLKDKLNSGIDPARLVLGVSEDLQQGIDLGNKFLNDMDKNKKNSFVTNADVAREINTKFSLYSQTLGLTGIQRLDAVGTITQEWTKQLINQLTDLKKRVDANQIPVTKLTNHVLVNTEQSIKDMDKLIAQEQASATNKDYSVLINGINKIIQKFAPEIDKQIQRNIASAPLVNDYDSSTSSGTKQPASMKQLQEFQVKVVAELQRLSASGTSDPVVIGRQNVLQRIKNDVDSVIQRLQEGALSPATVPILASDLQKALPLLGNPTGPLPQILRDNKLPAGLQNLFPGGLSPKDTEQMLQINNIVKGYMKKFFDGSSWSLNLRYDNPNVEKLRYKTSENLAKVTEIAKTMGPQFAAAGANTAGGLPGVFDSTKPLQAQDPGASRTSTAPNDAYQTRRSYDMGLPGTSEGRVLPSPPPAPLDWKLRHEQIVEQIDKRGLNAPSFGGIPKGTNVGPEFSWRGQTRMMCMRLSGATDPGLAITVGCPPENFAGWTS